ncbi:MAG: oligosaccharide flippase family protein [Lachnospiraceae bacterium]|nr:oligosaccharide flippase family protein [Lachnospiraceae bacterium]
MIEKVKEKYRSIPLPVKASFWFLICSVMQKGVSVITTPIFTRLLNTEEYGQYNVFNSWYSVLAVFVTLRLYFGVYSQGLVKFDKIRSRFSSSLHGLTLTLCVVWLGIYFAFSAFWNRLLSQSTSSMMAMFIIIWATAVFNFWAANERVEYQYKRLLIVTIIITVAKPLVGVLMVVNSPDRFLGRVWGLAFVELGAYFWMFIEQMWKGKVFFSRDIWKYALGFNLPLIPHYLAQTVLSSSDRIMIQKLVNTSSAGIYGLAYSIAMIMLIFNEAMQQTLAPWIYKKIKNRKTEDIHKVVYISLMLVAAVNLLLIVIAPEVVRLFAPADYYEAIWVIPPVAMSTYFIFLYNIFSYFEFYFEKKTYIAVSTVAAAVLNVVLNFFFIKCFGYYAAGYTTLFCYIVYAVLHYFVMRMICRKEFDGQKVLHPLAILGIGVVFLVLGFSSMALYDLTFVRYGIVAAGIVIAIIQRKKLKQFFGGLLRARKSSNDEMLADQNDKP